MKSKYVFPVAIIFVSLVLVSCRLQSNLNTPSVTATLSPINTHTTVILTDVDQLTSTLTPISALSEQDAFETFINLIEKNGECDLPCWLDVRPGETNLDEVVNNFSRFSAIAYTEFSSERAFIQVYFPSFEAAAHNTATGVASASDGKVSRVLIYAVVNPYINGDISYDNLAFQKMWKRYFMPGIFTEHGQPEKIFLDTTLIAADAATSYPFVLWIVYPQQGFLMRYQGINAKVGNNISICPMQSRIEIKIWDVKKSSYEEFIKDDRALGISTSLGPQPIESVTDFDIESFYETFKVGQLDTCFETPASIWPPN